MCTVPSTAFCRSRNYLPVTLRIFLIFLKECSSRPSWKPSPPGSVLPVTPCLQLPVHPDDIEAMCPALTSLHMS